MPRHPHHPALCLCLILPGCESGRSYSLSDGAPATGIRIQRDDRSPLQRLRDCERQGCSERQKIDLFTPILTTCARKATSRCPGKLPSSPVPDGLFRSRQIPSAALSDFLRTKKESLSPLEPISRQSPFAFHWSPNGNEDRP